MSRCKHRPTAVPGNRAGFTLVETLISSTILAIAIVSLVGFIRKGRELDISDGHRRRARAIIDSCFEGNAYQSSNYSNFAGVSGLSVVMEPQGYGRSANMTGALTITVSAENIATASVGGDSHYRELVATVSWSEPEGAQTLSLRKRMSPQ